MKNLETVLQFLKSLLAITGGQLLSIFGAVFIFGLVLFFLSRSTRRVYAKSAGYVIDVVFTGWIGTPVHEAGHALFCLIFFHKIQKIKLYDPNPKDGSIGYVIHSYDKNNLWQRTGNFFIGVGPLIFGSAMLYLLMYLLVPGMHGVFSDLEKHGRILSSMDLSEWQLAWHSLSESVGITLKALMHPSNFPAWKFWVFVYLAMCIASHMELSPPDLKGAFSGFITLALVILFVNLIVMLFETAGIHEHFGDAWKYSSLQHYMGAIARVTGTATALFIFAATISAINLIISWILLSLYSLIRFRKLINPFWG